MAAQREVLILTLTLTLTLAVQREVLTLTVTLTLTLAAEREVLKEQRAREAEARQRAEAEHSTVAAEVMEVAMGAHDRTARP